MGDNLNQLDVQTDRQGDITIVAVSGPVDSATFGDFKTALSSACSQRGSKVLLDCAALTYMNSRGFGLLSRCHQVQLGAMGRLALCNINRKLVKTMDLLGLGQTLTIYETREDALAKL